MSNNYAGLRQAFTGGTIGHDKAAAQRCAERLIALRKRLEPVRARRRDGALLLATWNIRDFDSNKFGFGPRLPESFYYLAEIISSFDLVAVQEVNRDLSALERLVSILGGAWDYIVTDATEGASGNSERMAFLFNRDKVWFRKIAGEVVLPSGQLIVSPATVSAAKPADAATPAAPAATAAQAPPATVEQQFARTPFLVAFQSGWFHFSLCTVHIYYGKESGPQLQRRIDEIERLVTFFASRQDKEAKAAKGGKTQAENYILLGDFNVVSPEHQTMKALKSHGFSVPAAIDGAKVRKAGDHFYDQIAVRVKDPRFKVAGGGIVDIYADVFRDTAADRALYAPLMPKTDPEAGDGDDGTPPATDAAALFRKWRTWQMSDHNPLWIEIATDFADDYLQGIVTQG